MARQNVPDPYAALGVPRTATDPEIGRAYRSLLRATHPDTRNNDAPHEPDASLAQALDAYALLHNPERRAHYDQHHPDDTPTPNQPAADTPTRLFIRARRVPEPPLQAGPVHWTPPV